MPDSDGHGSGAAAGGDGLSVDDRAAHDGGADSEPGRRSGPGPVRRFFLVFTLSVLAWIALCRLVVGDVVWWSEMFAIWPPVFWVPALLIPALGAFERRNPRPFLLVIGALALFLLAAGEWRHLLRRPWRVAPKPEGALRVVTWNCSGGWGGNAAVLAHLAEWKPDICFLQESPEGAGFFRREELTGWFDGWHTLEAGDESLLSRYPLERVAEKSVGEWPPVQLARAALPDGTSLTLVNAHLMLPPLRFNVLKRDVREFVQRSSLGRVAQYPIVAEFIAAHAGATPVILAGDLNTPGGMRSLGPLRGAGLRDVWPEAGRGPASTITNEFPVSRIDHVWVSPGIRAVAAWTGTPDISDHRPVIADLLVTPTR